MTRPLSEPALPPDRRWERNYFRNGCIKHDPAVAGVAVDLVMTDHRTDPPRADLARPYVQKFATLAADPSTAADAGVVTLLRHLLHISRRSDG